MNDGRGPCFVQEMCAIGLVKTLVRLEKRTWEDGDIPARLGEIIKELTMSFEAMTTFTQYQGEIRSRHLEWTPPHTSETFWKENIHCFEENEFEVVQEIYEILRTSKNEQSLAIACHDIGELVRYHPQGRKVLSAPILQGLDESVLNLITHESPMVSRHALMATQKILVQKWQYLDVQEVK